MTTLPGPPPQFIETGHFTQCEGTVCGINKRFAPPERQRFVENPKHCFELAECRRVRLVSGADMMLKTARVGRRRCDIKGITTRSSDDDRGRPVRTAKHLAKVGNMHL